MMGSIGFFSDIADNFLLAAEHRVDVGMGHGCSNFLKINRMEHANMRMKPFPIVRSLSLAIRMMPPFHLQFHRT
jgi:hypothetical protein